MSIRYFNWIQNSVFEGEITESKLSEFLKEAKTIIDKDTDSLIIFKIRQEEWLYKEVLGKEIDTMDNIL